MFKNLKLKLQVFLKAGIMLAVMPWVSATDAAVITINTSQLIPASSSDGLCSLTEAVDAANNNMASGNVPGECVAGELHPVVDVIEFDTTILPAFFTTATELTLNDSVHIKGPSQELVNFTGIGLNRVFRIINFASNAEFTISDVTFSDSAIRLPFDDYGGAIWAQHFAGASLTIERVKFSGNVVVVPLACLVATTTPRWLKTAILQVILFSPMMNKSWLVVVLFSLAANKM